MKKNFIYQVLYQLIVISLPLITSPYVSRAIGAEGIGIYSYSYSTAYYFVLIAMLGIANYGNRAIARVRDDIHKLDIEFSSIMIIHVIISVFSILLYIVYCLFFLKNKYFAFLQLPYVVGALFDISWFYFGIEKIKLTVIRNIIIKLITVLSLVVFVKDFNDTWKYCVIYSLSSLLGNISMWIHISKYVRFVKVSLSDLKKHIKPMIVLFIPTIAISLYKYMDKIMIGFISDKVQLGYYSNSESIITMAANIPAALGTVMLPQMSNLIVNKKIEKIIELISLSMKCMFIMSFALMFGLIGISQVFPVVFWGNNFLPCSSLLVLLSITIPFVSFANIIRNNYLLPNGMDTSYIKSVVVGAFVNMVLNVILIKSYGADGAAIATLFAECSVCMIQSYEIRNCLPLVKYIKESIPFLFIGIIMCVCVLFIGINRESNTSTLILQIIVGVVSYCTCSAIYIFKTKDIIITQLFKC